MPKKTLIIIAFQRKKNCDVTQTKVRNEVRLHNRIVNFKNSERESE